MSRRTRRVTGLLAGTLVALGAAAAPAAATTHTVTVMNMTFMNGTQTVHLGDSVVWSFQDAPTPHTTTSNQLFWRSSQHTTGTYTVPMRFAGRFAYHCEVHPDMTGAITVPLVHSGSSTAGYTLRWSSASTTPTSRAFEVMVKIPGTTTWAYLRKASRLATQFYNPTKTGLYSFRARTRNVTNGLASGWTPILTLRIS